MSQAVSQFTEEEKQTVRELLEGLIQACGASMGFGSHYGAGEEDASQAAGAFDQSLI